MVFWYLIILMYDHGASWCMIVMTWCMIMRKSSVSLWCCHDVWHLWCCDGFMPVYGSWGLELLFWDPFNDLILTWFSYFVLFRERECMCVRVCVKLETLAVVTKPRTMTWTPNHLKEKCRKRQLFVIFLEWMRYGLWQCPHLALSVLWPQRWYTVTVHVQKQFIQNWLC